jgi:hypothetical protein
MTIASTPHVHHVVAIPIMESCAARVGVSGGRIAAYARHAIYPDTRIFENISLVDLPTRSNKRYIDVEVIENLEAYLEIPL